MRSLDRLGLATFVLALAGCGSDPPPVAPAPPASTTAVSTVNTVPGLGPAPGAYVPLPPRFESPGGMWMPTQITAHGPKLKELGLAIDPKELSDPTSGVLSAIVSLGGCSASFISTDGLIATNHHCATGALQHNSTPAANLLKTGFLARTRADEKNNGPSARVFVTRALTDVTAKVTDGLAKVTDDRQRYLAIEKRTMEE